MMAGALDGELPAADWIAAVMARTCFFDPTLAANTNTPAARPSRILASTASGTVVPENVQRTRWPASNCGSVVRRGTVVGVVGATEVDISVRGGSEVVVAWLDGGAVGALVAVVVGSCADVEDVDVLTSLLTTTRESARRVGVEEAVGFTPRQLVGQGAIAGATLGLAAVGVGVPFGLLLFAKLSDLVGEGIGVGPGWMPMPTTTQLFLVAGITLIGSGGLGALAVGRLARRPVSELVRWE